LDDEEYVREERRERIARRLAAPAGRVILLAGGISA
jgi:hypothetical protein